MERKTATIYKNTTRWNLQKANEYLETFMEENNIDPVWKVVNSKDWSNYTRPAYFIENKETGNLMCNYGYRTLKSLVEDFEDGYYIYKTAMRQKSMKEVA